MLMFALVFSLCGCMKRNEEPPASEPGIEENDELIIYHSNSELAEMLIPLTESYSAATGKKISAKLAGNDFAGEVLSKNAAIYIVDTRSDLSDFHNRDIFTDFMNGSGLAELFPEIPTGLRLQNSGIGSFGIPLMLEGYGYILDRDMISDLFGAENANALIEDLRSCSFAEFEGFVAAVDTYISSPSAAEITIGGNKYTFSPEKTGKAQSLTGVFALNSESTAAMEHLFSYALASKFAGRYDVMNATGEFISGMGDTFSAFMEVLDLHTGHISGIDGGISRGDEFTGGDYGYSSAVDLFTKGYALFYPGGTADAADFEKSSAGFGKNLDIIPMKLPLDEEKVTAAGMTPEKLQSSIVIGSRYYISLNPSADEARLSGARDFLNWLINDEAGRNAYSSAFGKLPFNFALEYPGSTVQEAPSEENSSDASAENSSEAEAPLPEENPEPAPEPIPSHNLEDSLAKAVSRYYSEGKWIPDMSGALPDEFGEKVFEKGLSDFWGMETWAEGDRKNFVDIITEGWKSLVDETNTAVG